MEKMGRITGIKRDSDWTFVRGLDDGNIYVKTSKSAQTAPGVELKEGDTVAFIDNGVGCIVQIRVLSEPAAALQNVRVKTGIALGLIKPKKLLPLV